MTAPAILLAPDPETHARIVAWEQLARTNPKATFGPSVLLAVTAELRNARMAAHICHQRVDHVAQRLEALAAKIERLEGAQRAQELENDELAEQLRRARKDAMDTVLRAIGRLLPHEDEPGEGAAGYRGACHDVSLALFEAFGGPKRPEIFRGEYESAEPSHAGEPGDRATEVEA